MSPRRARGAPWAQRALAALLVALCLAATVLAAAQPDARDAADEPASAALATSLHPSATETLQAQIALVEADRTLEEAVREALLAELDGTRALLERADARRSRVETYEREAAARDEILAELSAQLSAPVTDRRWPSPDDSIATLAATATQIEEALIDAITTLLAARREETRLS